ISLAILFGCALSLDAQVAATLHRLPDGGVEIRIRNNSTVTLTAFAVKVDHATGTAASETGPKAFLDSGTIYADVVTDTTLQPLESGQERTREPWIRSQRGGPLPLKQVRTDARKELVKQVDLSEHTVKVAGLFADGTTSGDTGLVTRLMLRRSNMLLSINLT